MRELIAHKRGGSYTLEEIEQEARDRAAAEDAAEAEAGAQADQNAKGEAIPKFQKSADAD